MASDRFLVQPPLNEPTESTHPIWVERRRREARARQIHRDVTGRELEQDRGFRGVRYVGSSHAPEMVFL